MSLRLGPAEEGRGVECSLDSTDSSVGQRPSVHMYATWGCFSPLGTRCFPSLMHNNKILLARMEGLAAP